MFRSHGEFWGVFFESYSTGWSAKLSCCLCSRLWFHALWRKQVFWSALTHDTWRKNMKKKDLGGLVCKRSCRSSWTTWQIFNWHTVHRRMFFPIPPNMTCFKQHPAVISSAHHTASNQWNQWDLPSKNARSRFSIFFSCRAPKTAAGVQITVITDDPCN